MRKIKRKAKKLLFVAIMLLSMLVLSGTIQVSAAGTNVVKSAQKVSGGKWVGKKYKLSNGRYAKNKWLKIGSSIYRFDSKGKRVTGWIKYQNQKYYAASNGKLYVKKWLKKSGKYYYFKSTGCMAKNEMVSYGGKYYYVNGSGVRVKSAWVTYKGKRYYLDKNGVRLQKTWIKYKGKYYYVDKNGVKAVNKWVGDYYVGPKGARKTNCIVDGYHIGADGKRGEKVFDGNYIFVGDSRMEEMKNVVGTTDVTYIAKIGSGFEWLQSEAGPLLETYLSAKPDVKVVLAFGVNDLGNIDRYIEYYQELIRKYPQTKFHFISVNPVDEAKCQQHGYKVTNAQIVEFDKKLRLTIGEPPYINTYKFVKSRGVDTRDGLHYEAKVYTDLYNFIMSKIG
ncbi:hypothetical protein D7Y05_11365 [bacterium 1XD42-54]|nr:hypothetical protein D7Y05_11365 [bacterium 1XD42-54]